MFTQKVILCTVVLSSLFGTTFAFNQNDHTSCEVHQNNPAKYKACKENIDFAACSEKCSFQTKEAIDSSFCKCKCNGGVVLNNKIPFIGRCIVLSSEDNPNEYGENTITQLSAFPFLMRALMNIMLSAILIVSLIMIISGGIMIASSGANSSYYDQGKTMIRKVVIGLILLGASGIILAFINPNFFG